MFPAPTPQIGGAGSIVTMSYRLRVTCRKLRPSLTYCWVVNVGAVAIAVVFSLLPAYRAARLHPVRALRFE